MTAEECKPGREVRLARVNKPGFQGLTGVVKRFVKSRGVVVVSVLDGLKTYDAVPENLDPTPETNPERVAWAERRGREVHAQGLWYVAPCQDPVLMAELAKSQPEPGEFSHPDRNAMCEAWTRARVAALAGGTRSK